MEEKCAILLRHPLFTCSHLAHPHLRVDAHQRRVITHSYLTLFIILYRPHGSDCSVQKLLIGTHTSNDEQNYVQIMKVKITLALCSSPTSSYISLRLKSPLSPPKTLATTRTTLRMLTELEAPLRRTSAFRLRLRSTIRERSTERDTCRRATT